jgi:hypothetical protein
MSIQAPQGILNIPNAILRVGKLSVDEVVGADTILNTVARNTILLVDDEAYHENKNWSLKLPNAWAGEFECNTASAGNYSEFNFYNEGASSNAQGYNLTFNDTAVELRYDGTLLKTGTLASTITGTGVKKVRLMFERTILSVTVDGTLVFTHDDTVGPRPRVYSTTAGGFLNFFTDGGALKNLKIVNEKWMSDGTSNIAYVGGGEVAVGQALAFNRVSNVSQIKVDSNVVTEYTGPHDRPLRKYPEVAMTSASQGGYVVDKSEESSSGDAYAAYRAFDGIIPDGTTTIGWRTDSGYNQDTGLADGGVTRFTGDSGEWVELQLPNSIKLSSIVLKVGNQGNNLANSQRRFPKVFVIYGYNGTSWDRIQEYTTSAIQSLTDVQTFHISNPTAYHNKFVLVVKQTYSVTGATSGVTNIGELEYYGYEEGSGSLDTTLKSVYNVPATTGTQLEVYYDAKDLAEMPSIVTDLAGGDQNGTVTGHSPTLDETNGIESFKFDGVDDYITTTLTNPNTDWVHSVSMWVYPIDVSVDSVNGYMFAIGAEVSNQVSALRFSPDGFQYTRWAGGGARNFNGPVTSGRWHHVTLVSPGSTDVQVYLDGRLLGYTSDSLAALTLPQNTSLSVGRFAASVSYSRPFEGSIANFRLYSKALNAGQVQELYDYQKDYFLGSKSQVTLYKGHLGVGVTEPSGQLELAGDERIQEYPPSGMTNPSTYIEGHGVFTTSASSTLNLITWPAYKAFNKTIANTGDAWVSPDARYSTVDGLPTTSVSKFYDGVAGEWIQLDLPYSIKLKQTFLYEREPQGGSYGPNTSPRDVRILGKKQKSEEWVEIFSVSDLVYTQQQGNTPKILNVNSNDFYSSYVLQLTRIGGPDGADAPPYGWADVAEIKYFGTPGPTTLDKGSLSLTRSLDVPRVSRYDVDTETPRYEKLVVDFDTTVNSSPTDISGQGNHGAFYGNAQYSPADKAFDIGYSSVAGQIASGPISVPAGSGVFIHSISFWGWVDDWGAPFLYIDDTYPAGGSTNSTPSCVLDSNGNMRYDFWSNAVQVSNNPFPKNQWVHVGLVYKGGSVTSTSVEIYFNGVRQVVNSHSGNPYTSPSSVYLQFGSTSTINVKISNPKLYNVALEPSEVRKLYNLGRTGRSMVISDTAVGIGKVPEAQLDVRGSMIVRGHADFNFAYRELHMYSKPDVYIYNSSGTALTLPYNAGGKYLFFRFPNYYSKNFEPIIASDYRYYVPENGLYFVRFTPFGGGTLNYEWFINKNRNARNNNDDINYADGFGPYAYANGVAATTMSAIIPMTTTDYITFGAYVGSTNFDMSTRSSACITLIQRF